MAFEDSGLAMFSGIVEVQAKVLQAQKAQGIIRISVEKPMHFNDLSVGDSIACNGVCLTLEGATSDQMTFALGAETLQVTGWTTEALVGAHLNLERSLRFGDRVHGHLVTGHVDAVGKILGLCDLGGSLEMQVRVPPDLREMIWKKGSLAVHGVSLTVNSVEQDVVKVCLIPETLQRTNLGRLKAGDLVNLEVDWLARGLLHALELGNFGSNISLAAASASVTDAMKERV